MIDTVSLEEHKEMCRIRGMKMPTLVFLDGIISYLALPPIFHANAGKRFRLK